MAKNGIIDTVTAGLTPQFLRYFKKISKDNGLFLAKYLNAMKTETNISDGYRKSIIKIVSMFSQFCDNKSFRSMTRDEIIAFLNKIRKTEQKDPMHKWIGTYNYYSTILTKFFKWLYNPYTSPKIRPKPKVVQNIPILKRKEVSIYKPTDLWSEADDSIFLKYCPTKRIKCYHMVSRDTSGRPDEILKLLIKDVVFKMSPDKTKQYAEVLVNGKTGSRSIPLFNSIPYVKDYLMNEHPQPANPNAAFICGLRKKQGRGISLGNLEGIYSNLKKEYFQKLLQENISQTDKDVIAQLLRKPWNPYIRRHSGLTEKSLKIPALMNQYAGWTEGSKMSQKYFHYFGNESSNGLLEAYGILPKDKEQSEILKPKQCPNCNEPNKPDCKFCAKCRMVLTYDAYSETLEKQQEKESEVQRLQEKYQQDMKAMREEMNQQFSQIMSIIQNNPKLTQVKPAALINKKLEYA